jgi:hypothetical protein
VRFFDEIFLISGVLCDLVGVLDVGLESRLDWGDEIEVTLLGEDNVPSFFASASSAPSSMHVRVHMATLVVQNHINIVDIKASGSDIGSYQNWSSTIFAVLLDVVLSCPLFHVAVEHEEVGISLSSKLFDVLLGLAEENHFFVFVLNDELLDHGLLVAMILNNHASVLDSVRDLILICAHQINQQRVLKLLLSDFLNVGGNGGGEDHSLCVGHMLLQNFNVLIEAHVKHLVAFIKDLIPAATNIQVKVLAQVDEAAGCGNQNLRSFVPNVTHYKTQLEGLNFIYCSFQKKHRRRKPDCIGENWISQFALLPK